MVLAVDAGNSTVGFGLFEGGSLAAAFSAGSRPDATPDEYWSFISSQMARSGISEGEVGGAVISSVVPELVHVFFEALKGLTPGPPLIVSHRLKLGITIRYQTPESLGADRLASAGAAYEAHGGPVIVVDFGTATTFSAVDEGGSFVGGAIAPGLMTGYDALTARTSLPRTGLTYPKKAVGASTSEGIASGVVFGHAAMAEGMLARLGSELGARPKVVATGGLAGMVVPHMGGVDDTDPHLALKGLSLIYERNM